MPVAAAALLGLMMALSLGVDASPLRIHPKESKAKGIPTGMGAIDGRRELFFSQSAWHVPVGFGRCFHFG